MRLLCTRTRLVLPTRASLSGAPGTPPAAPGSPSRTSARNRGDRDCDPVLAFRYVDAKRRERAGVVRHLLAVEEHRRLVVDAAEFDRAALHARAVDPRPLGDPLNEPAIPFEVRVGHLARAHEVVD